MEEFCDPMVRLVGGKVQVSGLDARPFLVTVGLLGAAQSFWDPDQQVLMLGNAACRWTGRVRADALIFQRVTE